MDEPVRYRMVNESDIAWMAWMAVGEDMAMIFDRRQDTKSGEMILIH
jgi:hypothetical protein